MNGLILKDFINLKRNVKIFGALTVLYGFMALTQKDASFFTTIFTMLFAILTLSCYSYDELAKWDAYALTMPLSRQNIVQGKYIMMLLLTLIGTTFSMVFTLALNFILKKDTIIQGLTVSAVGAAVVIVFYSITIPIITKVGVEKARLIFFAVYMVPFVIIYLAKEAIKRNGIMMPEKLIRFLQSAVDNAYIIIPLVVIIALYSSYSISVYIYQKKDF
jgi:hypothetical protein